MVANKKQKTENGANLVDPPPPYGSREYWEDRYKKHCKTQVKDTGVLVKKEHHPSPEDDEALLFHEWYFNYEELRPLLLPIIFGGAKTDPNQNNDNATPRSNQLPNEEKVGSDVEEISSKAQNETAPNAEANDADDDDEWVEVEDGKESSDGSDSEECVEREGLGNYGPISIMEIGCGDVPLGAALAEELNELQRQTGSPAGCVVKRIVCIDFSETVISVLKTKHDETTKTQLETKPHLDRRNDVQLEYVTADARCLDYPDGSFHVILEKGTLDAMLSDKETGTSSSLLILSHCARILSVGGYFVLVSHLNAHALNGRQWLDEVVIPGLRDGAAKADWEIEVHGEQNAGENEEGEDEGEAENEKEESDDSSSSNSLGPAVYIIRKLPPRPGGDDESKVSLRLFAY